MTASKNAYRPDGREKMAQRFRAGERGLLKVVGSDTAAKALPHCACIKRDGNNRENRNQDENDHLVLLRMRVGQNLPSDRVVCMLGKGHRAFGGDTGDGEPAALSRGSVHCSAPLSVGVIKGSTESWPRLCTIHHRSGCSRIPGRSRGGSHRSGRCRLPNSCPTEGD